MVLLTCGVPACECRRPLVDSVPEDQRAEGGPSRASPAGGSAGGSGHSAGPLLPQHPPSAQTAAGDGANAGEGVLSSGLMEGGGASLAPPECDAAAGDDGGLSAGGASALQPVASVSTDAIALRWFWLRFFNDEIEAM